MANYPIVNLPNLYKSGLVPGIQTGSTTKLNILAGRCRDSTNTMDLVVGSPNLEGQTVAAPLVLDFTIAGVNGVDVLPVTNNSMYAIYIIGDSTYNRATACLASLNNATIGNPPLMPRGYDTYRLVAFWGLDGSGLLLPGVYSGVGNNLKFFYDGVLQVLSGGTATTYTPVSLGAFVPISTISNVTLEALFSANAVADTASFRIASFTNANTIISSTVASVPFYTQIEVPCVFSNSNQQIQYKVSSASDSISLYVSSFEVSL